MNPTEKKPLWRTLVLAASLIGLTQCVGSAVGADDAGDAAFVFQAIQTLLGRRPKGLEEVVVLTAVAANPARGRAAVVDVLMEEPDFVEYWVPVLADAMRMQRSSYFKQASLGLASPLYMVDGVGAWCATSTTAPPPLLHATTCAARATTLANHIRDDTPDSVLAAGVPIAFNLNDALRAAIAVDDLHIAWRPWLFALAGKTDGGMTIDTRDNFLETAFNVQTACVKCHSSTYSKTEVYDPIYEAKNTWDRTSTLGKNLELATFRSSDHVDLVGDPTCFTLPLGALQGIAPVPSAYHVKCAGCHGDDGKLPLTCVNGSASPKTLAARVPLMTDAEIVSQILSGSPVVNGASCMAAQNLDGLAPTGPSDANDVACASLLVTFLREKLGGYPDFARYVNEGQFSTLSLPPAGYVGPWGLANAGFTWKPNVVQDGRNRSFGGISTLNTDVQNVAHVLKLGLAALPAEPAGSVYAKADSNLPSTSTATVSVATLLAQNVADDILDEISGGRMTVAHGLPRNLDQAVAMQTMVDTLVVESAGVVRLSLKSALRGALLSIYYNRTAPKNTNQTLAYGKGPYQLPMHANPWAATKDGITTDVGANLNGQGDIVHRRSPNQVLRSLHTDLGWPAPVLFPTLPNVYPSPSLMDQMGRYKSYLSPGTEVWDLNSLVLYEDTVGLCAQQGPTPDWISTLVTQVFAPVNPLLACGPTAAPTCATPTMLELTLSLKNRLLQEAALEPVTYDGITEKGAIAAAYDATLVCKSGPPCNVGTAILDSSTSLATKWKQASVEGALRSYCGALLLSSDYLLAGIPKATPAAGAPLATLRAVNMCLPGEICTAVGLASHYCAALDALGYTCP